MPVATVGRNGHESVAVNPKPPTTPGFREMQETGTASAMVAAGHPLAGMRRDEKGVIWFRFRETPEFQASMLEFLSGNLMVNIARYQSAMTRLRRIVFGNH